MTNILKPAAKPMKTNRSTLLDQLDMSLPATAAAFRVAAKDYTRKATKSKATAIATLHRENILTKTGAFTKLYAMKD